MMLRMTAPRALMAVAVLLGLLSTCLAKAIRVEKLHTRPVIASNLSHEPARQSAERLALVIGNSGYPDAIGHLRAFPAPPPTLLCALCSAARSSRFVRLVSATRVGTSRPGADQRVDGVADSLCDGVRGWRTSQAQALAQFGHSNPRSNQLVGRALRIIDRQNSSLGQPLEECRDPLSDFA